MFKFWSWLQGKDLEKYRVEKLERNEKYKPLANPADLGEGFKLLNETMIELNVSTTFYSRILILLTVVLIILTILLLFPTIKILIG